VQRRADHTAADLNTDDVPDEYGSTSATPS